MCISEKKIESLRQIIHHILPINDYDWNDITPHLSQITFKKNDLLLSPPNSCHFIAFILSGSCRSYFIDDELNENNLLLRSQFEFITDYESFITQDGSKLHIEALEDGEAILLEQKALNKLYESSFYWNKFGRIMSEQIFINSKRRNEELLFLTPTERYIKLTENNPDFFQKYALKHIASYLGISAPSLSHIRKQIFNHLN